MISSDTQIIGKLSGNQVLVAKKQNADAPDSTRQQAIDRLKSRDREVRAHEASHSTSPELIKIGSAQFDYTIGPDGKAYATGGKVTLTTGNARTPEEALSKAEALKKASMAPGAPSSQDFQALNAAVAMEFEARNQIYSDKKNIDKNSLSLLKGTNFSIYA
jgi:hypothetical protein